MTPQPSPHPLLTSYLHSRTKETVVVDATLCASLLHWSPTEVNTVNAIDNTNDRLDAIGTRHANIILGESETTTVALASPLANANTTPSGEPDRYRQHPTQCALREQHPQHTQHTTPSPETKQIEPIGTTVEPDRTS